MTRQDMGVEDTPCVPIGTHPPRRRGTSSFPIPEEWPSEVRSHFVDWLVIRRKARHAYSDRGHALACGVITRALKTHSTARVVSTIGAGIQGAWRGFKAEYFTSGGAGRYDTRTESEKARANLSQGDLTDGF